jgi:hypothetical protein
MTRPSLPVIPLTLSALALLTLLGACSRQDPPVPTASRPTTSAAAPASAPPAAEATPLTTGEPTTKLSPGDIPTPEDFEEEAEQKLVSANLEVELDALEQEIGQ